MSPDVNFISIPSQKFLSVNPTANSVLLVLRAANSVLLLSVASAVTLNGHPIFLFFYNFKVNSGNVCFICLAAETLAEKQSSVEVFFITQIGHRPRASNSKQGQNKDLKKKQGRIMTILELQYDSDPKRLYLKLNRNSFWIFSPANDIVSCREFISSPPMIV